MHRLAFVFACSLLSISVATAVQQTQPDKPSPPSEDEPANEQDVLVEVFGESLTADGLRRARTGTLPPADPRFTSTRKRGMSQLSRNLDIVLRERLINIEKIEPSFFDVLAAARYMAVEVKKLMEDELDHMRQKLQNESLTREQRERLEQRMEDKEAELERINQLDRPLDEIDPARSTYVQHSIGMAAGIALQWRLQEWLYAEHGGGDLAALPEGKGNPRIKWYYKAMPPYAIEAKRNWIDDLMKRGELVLYDQELRNAFFEHLREFAKELKAIEPNGNPYESPPWSKYLPEKQEEEKGKDKKAQSEA